MIKYGVLMGRRGRKRRLEIESEYWRLRAEQARWAKDKAKLEMERDVLKRAVAL